MHRASLQIGLLFAFFVGPGAFSQQATLPEGPQQPRLNLPQPDDPNSNPSLPPDIRKQMQKRANEQRQAELKRDTDRLVKLSTELKDYVDKSNENILSLDVMKKAEEIEKLAHNVKQKMRGEN